MAVSTEINGKNVIIYIHSFSETVSDNIRSTKTFFEIDFLNYVKARYPDHTEIIDIGANIGNHSLFFANFLNCSVVHSFEPHPENIAILHKNLDSFGKKCVIYETALSNKEGEMTLYNSQAENYGGFSLHSYSNGCSFIIKEKIPVKTLDSYNLTNISMIKIDVENHENEVLEGAKSTILRNKPIIFLENLYHGYPQVQPNPDIHRAIFEDYGYTKVASNIVNGYMDLWVPV